MKTAQMQGGNDVDAAGPLYENQVLRIFGQYLQEEISAPYSQIDRQGHVGQEFCQRDATGKGVTPDRQRYSALPPLQARTDGVPGNASSTEYRLR
ncbi:MAG: hypothetical protein GWP11_00675 [Proteobacteria bacterium]|nr:hypothetical protein [Pseudomonadota bacterium]